MFGNMTTDGLEQSQDRLGGFTLQESDIYLATIKAFYAGKADSGAMNITVIADLNGKEYRETIYITNKKGDPEPDPDLRDNENVPLPAIAVTWEPDPTDRLATLDYRTAVNDYMAAEVLPYVPDAWVDHTKTKLGYEVPLTRHFYKYVPPRPLAQIDAEIKQLEAEIQALLAEVAE